MEDRIPLSVKYRPKKLSDIIGQEVPVRILTNSWKDRNWHHSYILSGEMGSGKTTVSRIMAAMENCENGPTLEPCGKCDVCQSIYDGTSVDIKEMDAASNRSIDDIRAIQEDLHNYPINCRTKYIILDEAHSLTGYAAEAALKMIEEPPSFVRFIFCTTEIESFKPTILSRCMSLNFKKVDALSIHQYLNNIAKLENISYKENALLSVARYANGSMRNALQNLQTVYSFAGNECITEDIVNAALGIVDDVLYFSLINSILEFNAPEAIRTLSQIAYKECNTNKIVEGLVRYLRFSQLYLLLKDDAIQLGATQEDIKRISLQSNKIKPSLISKMFGFIVDVQKGIYMNVDPISMLENAFVIPSIIEAVKIEKENRKKI